MEAVVVDSTANSIVVEDLTGDLETVQWTGEKAELCEAGSYTVAVPIAGFVPSRGSTGASLRSVSLRSIFAFNDSKQANAPTYQTQGRPKGANPQNACHFAGRTSAPSFASSQTTFTDVDADDNGGGFASWMIGSILVPDVNIGAPLLITGATATTLTVAGDVETVRWTVERVELCGAGSSGVASSGSQYIVYAAPFTDPVRGTWQTDPHKGGTRYLWAGYRYQPPQMGFYVDPPGAPALGVYGAATGVNRLGQYYCWNRNYEINTGRWTTPDPVATPWWNLWDYCDGQPVNDSDSTGLCALAGGTTEDFDTLRKHYDALRKAGMPAKTAWAVASCIAFVFQQRRMARENRPWGGARSRTDLEGGDRSKGNCWRYATDRPLPAGTRALKRDASGRPTGSPIDEHQGHGNERTWDGTKEDLDTIIRESGGKSVSKDGKCPPPSWKIAAVMSPPPPPQDFHYYRQNSDGRWTHKRGPMAVESTDAGGAEITDPETCNRNYEPAGRNYSIFVGYYCIS